MIKVTQINRYAFWAALIRYVCKTIAFQIIVAYISTTFNKLAPAGEECSVMRLQRGQQLICRKHKHRRFPSSVCLTGRDRLINRQMRVWPRFLHR